MSIHAEDLRILAEFKILSEDIRHVLPSVLLRTFTVLHFETVNYYNAKLKLKPARFRVDGNC